MRALRVYERHGLVRPARTAAGWRVYGPAELSRLHQVTALKRVGLKLVQIEKLVRGNAASLDRLLALQEDELLHRKRQTDRALVLVRKARKHIAEGKTLALDAFVTLIKDTRVPNFEFSPQYKALWAKHIDARRLTTLHSNWTSESGARFKTQWVKLIAEAEGLKNCDPGAPQVLDLARRARAHIDAFTRGDPEMLASLIALCQEGITNPDIARHMPYSQELWKLWNAAQERLDATEGAHMSVEDTQRGGT